MQNYGGFFVRFDFSPPFSTEPIPMNVCRLLLIAATATTLVHGVARADDQLRKTDAKKPAISIFDKSEPSSLANVKRSRMSVAELRQARALLKADQRRARMEYNAWIGHEPLRPNWSAVPTMRSRYERQTIFLPVYYYRR